MSRKADIHTHKTTTHTHTLTCVHSIARTVILAQFNHGIWPVAAIDPEGVITVLAPFRTLALTSIRRRNDDESTPAREVTTLLPDDRAGQQLPASMATDDFFEAVVTPPLDQGGPFTQVLLRAAKLPSVTSRPQDRNPPSPEQLPRINIVSGMRARIVSGRTRGIRLQDRHPELVSCINFTD